MVFMEVTEMLFCLLVIGIILTQITIPALMGRPVFPWFKSKNMGVEQKIAKTKEEIDIANKEEELQALQEKLKCRKKKKETNEVNEKEV